MINPALNSSRFIAFFDESGDHSLANITSDFPVFALSTVIVEREKYITDILPRFNAFKMRYFEHEGVNLHSRDIRKATGAFSILMQSEIRTRFLPELSELINSIPFTLFVTVIKKIDYLKRHSGNPQSPYDIAVQFSFERILHFMEAHLETNLPVIAEGRGLQEDNDLRANFQKLMTNGTNYNSSERFRKLNCPINFRKKTDNICGLQIADLCAYPTAQSILNPQRANLSFECIKPHFYKNGSISGFKIFP